MTDYDNMITKLHTELAEVKDERDTLLREVEGLRKEHEAAEPLVKYFETFSASDFNLDDIIKHRAAHAAAQEVKHG